MSLKKFKEEFLQQSQQAEGTGEEKKVVQLVMTPLFEEIGKKLNVDKLYIWTGRHNDNLVKLTLSDKRGSKTATAIFCFGDKQDAQRHPNFSKEEYQIQPIDIFNLLLHFATLPELDLLLVYNQKGHLNKYSQIERSGLIKDFQKLCWETGLVPRPVAETGHFGLA
ncbi:hypothetical protein IQ219_00640 [Synechocystis sp. LEGE 06083]|uniref:hypothetical protein n=1 Tax=Synechocystis sp. LEGE 06083 TaxID=915336 RepID=UPI00187EABFB|nr:hypothetical protein [Synechocystis sp. LEGE 06083]MBE9193864.1 hypothetical protein [Synechocystis sp. LEGE 06083]